MSEITWEELREQVHQLSLDIEELRKKTEERERAWKAYLESPERKEFLELYEKFRSSAPR